MHKYIKEFNIPYYDGDKLGYIRTVNILKYFGEASAQQTEEFLMSNEIIDVNYGWMLYRWKVEINEYPQVKKDVYVKTWVSKLDRFYAFREFTLSDKDGNIIVKASTVWLCVDMNKKRPIKIPKEYLEGIKIINEANFKEFYDFKEDLNINSYIDFKIRRSDIDYNNHVNNTQYVSWIIESMTEDIYKDYLLSEFEIIYKKEIKYGDIISAGFNLDNREDGCLNFTHKITDVKKNEEYALGKTKWIKRL